MNDAFAHGGTTPRVVDDSLGALAPHGFGELDHALGSVGPTVEEHVLHALQQVRGDILVDCQLSGIDDGHVEAGLLGVKEKHGMEGFSNRLVAAEAETEIADTATDPRTGQLPLDTPRRLEKFEPEPIVAFDAGRYREDVGIEDDVLRIEPGALDEQPIRPLTDLEFSVGGFGLALLIESHHDRGSSIAAHAPGFFQEIRLPFLEADGIDDGLALHVAEPRLDDRPLGAVDHDGDARNVRFSGDQPEELRHDRLGIQHGFVDVDVDDIGSVLYLIGRNLNRLGQLSFPDQSREALAAGHIGAFAHHDEVGIVAQRQSLQARIPRQPVGGCGTPRRHVAHRFGNGANMTIVGSTATADDIAQPIAGKLAKRCRHRLGSRVVLAESVGQTRVRIAAGHGRRELGQDFQVRAHVVCA